MRRSLLFAVLADPALAVVPALAMAQTTPATTAPAAAPAAHKMMKTHHAARVHHKAHRTANSEQDQTRKLNEEQLNKK
ncbi:hypothetical protein [Inquilinus limosus]|nr:hypothetical protein [Inquilinus limosus]